MNLEESRQKQFDALKEEYKKNPALFERNTAIEDAETLRDFGIYIPGKENFPQGYVKLFPSDFIVEEVMKDGTILTTEKPNPSENQKIKDPAAGIDFTVYATLVKCTLSTLDALQEIAQTLGCPLQQIQYAGVKDKDAITAQRISFRNISPTKIQALSSPHYFLKDLSVSKGVVEKGGLLGNRFTILIRTNELAEKGTFVVDQLKKIKEEGFYNFYYLQRFGTPRLIGFSLGLKIMRGDYRGLIEFLITETNEREFPFLQALRKDFKAHSDDLNYIHKKMLDFPLIFAHEIKVIEHLLKKPGDYIGALITIADQIRFWIYAFSSLLFNEKISLSLLHDETLPPELPLVLSNDRKDVAVYEDLLRALQMYPLNFEPIRPFSAQVRLQKRMIATKDHVEINAIEVVPEGMVMSFTLGKGEYATTFLSHIFNLIQNVPPETLPKSFIDIKSSLGDASNSHTVEFFKEFLNPKTANIFEGED